MSSFVFAHVLDSILYYPDEVLADPALLLRLWEGLSSFGGFVGASIGAIAWRVHYKAVLLPYADIVASAFPGTIGKPCPNSGFASRMALRSRAQLCPDWQWC